MILNKLNTDGSRGGEVYVQEEHVMRCEPRDGSPSIGSVIYLSDGSRVYVVNSFCEVTSYINSVVPGAI